MLSILKYVGMTVVLLCTACQLFAQDESTVVVHLKGGRETRYLMRNVDYVEIITPESTPDENLETVGGSVAEPVDLGLSVNWASHNLGADCPSDFGGFFSLNDEQLNAWGQGWRLPTEEEWQELYDRCQWKWVVYNGVGCRQISTKDGSIILPAAGVMLGETRFAEGSFGLYLTSDEGTAENGTAEVNIAGAYFDSANIYKMEFPRSNRFSVRLVRDKGAGYVK